ncbi:MAG: hypothetical protein ACRCYQ_06760 [Nocardioides sp.]
MTPDDLAVTDWLLEGDSAVRWQVLRDLTDAPSAVVAAERAKVAGEGWAGRLLELQDTDGRWDGGVYRPGWVDEEKPFFDAWTATHFSLTSLREFGVEPGDARVRAAVVRVRDNVRWSAGGAGYFEGETEPCINGLALANAAYFGEATGPIVSSLFETQLADGGWNCFADHGAKVSSFHSTICVLEGLAQVRRHTASSELDEAAARAEEYLLARHLLYRASTGETIDPRFTMLSYPTRWYYDMGWALDYFARAERPRDRRCADAVELLRTKRRPDGRWPLEHTHQGPTLFELGGEFEGEPSRWVTLRALRVLRWWGG